MKRFLAVIMMLAAGTVAAAEAQAPAPTTPAAPAAKSLDELLQQVRAARTQAAAINKKREDEFRAARDQQRALVEQARRELAAEEARSNRLKETFDANERELTQQAELLRARLGNLGEVFGVVRQVAGDTKGVVDNSLVSAQIKGRSALPAKLSQAKTLPSIEELEGLWFTLQEEMTESGKVVKFPATIVNVDGSREDAEVVRVGVFNVSTEDRFLGYQPETGALVELARQPEDRYRDMAEDLFEAEPGEVVEMTVDPSRGVLLSLLIEAPTFMERVHQGQLVGYITMVIGFIGFLVAVERLLFFHLAGQKIRAQLSSGKPNPDNALGRILAVYSDNKSDDLETLELKLDEAIMKEVPQFEARLGFLKLVAAVGPLLGLLGTVTGMIQTFQSITMFGTGDPKLMAGGISQALVTTVQGLCVAIPMVLLHGLASARSKEIVQILEEQTAGIIAAHAEKRK